MKLLVYKQGTLTGTLDMASGEPFFGFTYNPEYLEARDATPVSLSLPLREERYSGDRALPFFEGLLPEGDARWALARALGVSPTSSTRLLRALGKDCAGDCVVLEEDDPWQPPAICDYAPLEGGIEAIAKNPEKELPFVQERYRLSLAGGQSKAALYHNPGSGMEEGWYAPLHGSPSTHIVKPAISARYPKLAENEFVCMRAAARMGIPTANCSLVVPTSPALAVERYDRASLSGSYPLPAFSRLHQEDMCQATGTPSARKYEADGGPGLKEVRDVIVANSVDAARDLVAFLRMTLFNFVVGNCDAHAKNFSVVWRDNGLRLSPAYDLVSTVVYDGEWGAPLSRTLGMRIGNHTNIERVNRDDIACLSSTLGMSARLVRREAERTADLFNEALEFAVEQAAETGFDAEEIAERIARSSESRLRLLTM